MAIVKAICPGCKEVIQLEDQKKTAFCMYCGARVFVKEAAASYSEAAPEAPDADADAARAEATDMHEVEELLRQNSFTRAETLCRDIMASDPENPDARWGLILAGTRNLEAATLNDPSDYMWEDASALFEAAGPEKAGPWKERYLKAYFDACIATVDSYDPRVFVEVSVYKWNTKENRFEYPIDRNYPIEAHVDKSVRAHLAKLSHPLPPELAEEFGAAVDRRCTEIADCFRSGFRSLQEVQGGQMKKLLGTWAVKHASGDLRTEIIRIYKNDLNVYYCENMRTSINRLDYFRFLGMDASGSLTCRELRRFPSRSGTGGDYLEFAQPKAFLQLFALYDYLLVLPNGIFSRADPAETENLERALAFQKKCMASPCFIRDGSRSTQMRPASENHNTSEPSRRVSSCYIATAVYGDVDEPHVRILRRFRDDVMHQSAPGRFLSSAYYRHSPRLAARLRDARRTNRVVRGALNALTRLLAVLYPPADEEAGP